jgi:glycosyltransferase involved in cell wall biosynthesis
MKHLKGATIIMPFHARLEDGCDYVFQTMRILGQENMVIGIALGDPVTWSSMLSFRKFSFFIKGYNSLIIRPLYVFPGVRFEAVVRLNVRLWAFFLYIFQLIWNKSNVLLWVFEPLFLPVFQQYWRSVYDCVDAHQFKGESWAKDEKAVLQNADIVVVNSESLRKLHCQARPDAAVVPPGLALHLFSEIKKIYRKKSHVFTIGYTGPFTSRIDFQFLFGLIKKSPRIRFHFIGEVLARPSDNGNLFQNIDKLKSFPNVSIFPSIPKAQIPARLALFDAGLIPYDPTQPFNYFSYPMKLLEYFAAGLPVISTPLPEVCKFSGLVYCTDQAATASKILSGLSKQRWPAEKIRKQVRIASANAWKEKISQIEKVINQRDLFGEADG